MNWFERYGIVGMFFVTMAAFWLFCFVPDKFSLFNDANKSLSQCIMWISGLSFLPIGYLIMIWAQLLYYRKRNGEHIHCEYWETLSCNTKNEILENEQARGHTLTEKEQHDEAVMEAILTYYDRKYIAPLAFNEFASTFATKRYHVYSVNHGFMLAILLSPVFALLLELVILEFSFGKLPSLFRLPFLSVCVAAALSIGLYVLLHKSSKVMRQQILEIGKRKIGDIRCRSKEES